jgi:hypothetical protein
MRGYTCMHDLSQTVVRMAYAGELLVVMATRNCLHPDRCLFQGAVCTFCTEVVEGQVASGRCATVCAGQEGRPWRNDVVCPAFCAARQNNTEL